MFYSKLIFKNGVETPPQAPSQTPDQKAEKLEKRSQQKIDAKRKAAENLKDNKKELLKRWKENNPEKKVEAIEDDPKTVAIERITDSLKAKETYLLISLMEEYFGDKGEKLAKKFLAKGLKQSKSGDINLKYFREFFSWKGYEGKYRSFNVPRKLGFYYLDQYMLGWTTVDRISVGPKSDKDDEPSGERYLVNALYHIKAQYNQDTKDNDMGLSEAQLKKGLKFFKDKPEEFENLMKKKESGLGKDTIKWFKEKANEHWEPLTEKMAAALNVVIGKGVGKYLYRYNENQKRIYAILIQGQEPEPDLGVGGYMEIKDDKIGSWNKFEDYNKFKTEYIDDMEADKVSAEVGKEKSEAGEEITKEQKLKQTAGMISTIKGIKEGHPTFHDLDDYYEDIKTKLKKELKEKKGITKNLDSIVQARVDDIKSKVDSAIESDEALKEAGEKDKSTKLEIRVNSNDEVTVKFDKPAGREKWRKLAEKAKEKGSDVGALAKKARSQLNEKVKKMFGKGAPIAMWFLDKILKIDEGIKKILSGKSAPITAFALGALGISVTPALVGARKYNSKKFDKLLSGLFKDDKEKEAKYKKKVTLTQDYKLSGYSITIPKGEGIILKSGKKLQIKGGELVGKKEKKKGLFSGGEEVAELGKDQEIVIEDGTTIPDGTIIKKMKVKKS